MILFILTLVKIDNKITIIKSINNNINYENHVHGQNATKLGYAAIPLVSLSLMRKCVSNPLYPYLSDGLLYLECALHDSLGLRLPLTHLIIEHNQKGVASKLSIETIEEKEEDEKTVSKDRNCRQ